MKLYFRTGRSRVGCLRELKLCIFCSKNILKNITSSLAISSGGLTLDAQGNGDAVFIFQAASSLTTTAGRQVILFSIITNETHRPQNKDASQQWPEPGKSRLRWRTTNLNHKHQTLPGQYPRHSSPTPKHTCNFLRLGASIVFQIIIDIKMTNISFYFEHINHPYYLSS
jgi:hypothetical protein